MRRPASGLPSLGLRTISVQTVSCTPLVAGFLGLRISLESSGSLGCQIDPWLLRQSPTFDATVVLDQSETLGRA